MNRGQILYRVAELMEGRFDQFTGEVAIAEGLEYRAAREVVGRAIDRWVWYAGWTDKIAQVLGSSNPVGAPYFNFTIPEPTGVVGVVAPERTRCSASCRGSRRSSRAATSRSSSRRRRGRCPRSRSPRCSRPPTCPGGVVNILTGHRAELVPPLAAHVDVDARGRVGDPGRPPEGRRGGRRGLRQARRPPPDAA